MAVNQRPVPEWEDLWKKLEATFGDLPEWSTSEAQLRELLAKEPGAWEEAKKQLEEVKAPDPAALPQSVQDILNRDKRFSDTQKAEYDAQRKRYFDPGGILDHVRTRAGAPTPPPPAPGTPTPPPGLRREFKPAIDAARAELRTGAGTTLGRLSDLYDEAMMDVSRYGPGVYGTRARNEAQAAVDARTLGALDRVGGGRQGLAAAMELTGALEAARQGAIAQTRGEEAGYRLRGGALDRAAELATGRGEHRLGAAETMGDLLGEREAAVHAGNTYNLSRASDVVNQWRGALADWNQLVGNRLSADLGAWNTAVGAHTSWLGQQQQTARQNAAQLGAGWQTWLNEQGQTRRSNAGILGRGWQSWLADRGATQRGRESIAGGTFRDWMRLKHARGWEGGAGSGGGFFGGFAPRREIVSREDPYRTGVFDLGGPFVRVNRPEPTPSPLRW